MTVRLNTLGRLQVFRESEELTSYSLRGTRCALLLYITLEGKTTHDAAMAAVWPEKSPEKARHSLSQTLYELRKDLGEDWVESTGEVLKAGDLESDAARFGVAVETEEYGDALSLYQGPFLEGTYLVESPEFQAWVERRRSAIERMRRNAQRGEVEHRLGRGDLDGALAMTQSWVDYDPLDDEAQHALIKLLADAGRRSEALSQFEEFERTLRRELEVSPLEDTCRLVERIRAGGEETPGAHRLDSLAAHADSSLVVAAGPQGTALERGRQERGVRDLLEASLAGEFDIVRKIGDGTRAEIYLAREVNLRRLVAIKVLRSEHAESETTRRRFVREAQAAARISDPNVASVFRTGVLDNEHTLPGDGVDQGNDTGRPTRFGWSARGGAHEGDRHRCRAGARRGTRQGSRSSRRAARERAPRGGHWSHSTHRLRNRRDRCHRDRDSREPHAARRAPQPTTVRRSRADCRRGRVRAIGHL